MDIKRTGSRWMWDERDERTANQYLLFKQEISIEDISKARMYISCDTNYALYINGLFVNTGQYLSRPFDKYYDSLEIESYLKKGKNELLIYVYYQGVGTQCYETGKPGLIYAIKHSGGFINNLSAMVSKHTGFAEGDIPMITTQLGPSFEYDAREYKPEFEKPTILEFSDILPREISKRPIEKQEIREQIPLALVAMGEFRYKNKAESVADRMQNASMSHCTVEEITDNTYIILDMGKESTGYFTLDIEAESGVCVDVAYGEHLLDGRVRAKILDRNFAFTYYTKEGRNQFTNYFRRIAGRYLQINFSNVTKPVTVKYIGINESTYPAKVKHLPKIRNQLHKKICEVSIHTLKQCMHEHYEDSPWREQCLYAFDARNQALFGYPIFKDYRYVRSNISLLEKGIGEDGYVDICVPSSADLKIPSFSMLWIIFACEYAERSKDKKTAKRYMETIKRMLSIYQKSMKNGLLPIPDGEEYWIFYEWVEEDCSELLMSNGIPNEKRVDAIFNLFLCYALKKVMGMQKLLGEDTKEYKDLYDTVRTGVNQSFFRDGVYRTYLQGDECCELAQALAICSDVAEDKDALRQKLTEKTDLIESSLCTTVFKYEALLEKDEYVPYVLKEVEDIWGKMVRMGATSFYETIGGANAFDGAGSLCHGWSAIPLYVYCHKNVKI